MATSLKQLRSNARDFALGLPGATEDFPWGERVVKVNKKVFVFLGRDMDAHFGLGVKLGASHAAALATPSVAPMGYGLGKSGWVSAKFETSAPPFPQLRAWVLESYCAVAPAKLAAQVGGAAPAKTAKKKAAPTAVKKAPAKRPAKTAPAARSKPKSAAVAVRSKQRAAKR